MVTFCVLVAPLPYTIKKRVFSFLSESKLVAKVAYGLKISFMWAQTASLSFQVPLNNMTTSFVAILFADALQRMFRVSAESEMAKQHRHGMVQDIRTDTGIAAKKF